MSIALAIGLGMLVGAGGLPPASPQRDPLLSGFVPLVEWPDGAQIGRVAGNVQGEFGVGEFGVQDLAAFVYVDFKGKVTSQLFIQFASRVFNQCSITKESTEYGRWIWFLFSYLGIPFGDIPKIGVPLQDSTRLEKLRLSEDSKRVLAEMYADPDSGFWDWEYFNHVMVKLGHFLGRSPRYPDSYSTNYSTNFHGCVLYLKSKIDSNLMVRLYREEPGPFLFWQMVGPGRVFEGKKYASFWDMLESNVLIDEGEIAMDRWLDAREDPGLLLGHQEALNTWSLLMDRPAALAPHKDFLVLAASLGYDV